MTNLKNLNSILQNALSMLLQDLNEVARAVVDKFCLSF